MSNLLHQTRRRQRWVLSRSLRRYDSTDREWRSTGRLYQTELLTCDTSDIHVGQLLQLAIKLNSVVYNKFDDCKSLDGMNVVSSVVNGSPFSLLTKLNVKHLHWFKLQTKNQELHSVSKTRHAKL